MKESDAVSALPVPDDWEWNPLGRMTKRSRADGHPEWPPLSVFLGIGVVPRSEREDNHNQLGADLSKYLTVEPRDLVFNKLRTWQGGFGASTHRGIVSPAYYVLRPNPSADSRYLHYLLHSAPYLAELTRLSKWMPPSQFDMPWEHLKQLPIPLPLLAEQRRIADFLDDQVTRIDQVIALRKRQVALVPELVQSGADALYRGVGRPLRWFLRQDPCYGVLVPRFTDAESGVPLIRVNDLAFLDGRAGTLELVEADQAIQYRRTSVAPGDVLVSVVGSIDKVAIVPTSLEGANIARAVARLVPRPGLSPVVLLGWTLTSGYQRQARLATGSDTAQPTLNMGDLKKFAANVPDDTDRLVLRVGELLVRRDETSSTLNRSIRLLQERKRSLITAAVTGEFDVSTASPRAASVTIGGPTNPTST